MSRSADIRTQPIVNLVTMPRPADAPQGLDWNSIWGQAPRGTVAIGTVNGEQALIYTATEANTTSQNRFQFRMAPAGIAIKPSTKYTLYVEMTSITTPKQIGTGFEFSNDSGRHQLFSSVTSSSKQSFTREWTSPSVIGSTRNFWMFVSGSIAIGDQFAVHRVMLVEGSYSGVYSDGDTFNWKWQGAPYNSQSIGYPYTLESIAGAPLAERTTSGDTEFSIGALQGRTLYCVYDATGSQSQGFTMIAQSGVVSNDASVANGFQLDSGASGTTTMRSRFDYLGGSINRTMSQPLGRSAGRHIGWAAVSEGLTQRSTGYDQAAAYVSVSEASPGTGMPYGRLGMQSGSEFIPMFSALYGKEHSEATRARVMAWLANKYGLRLP